MRTATPKVYLFAEFIMRGVTALRIPRLVHLIVLFETLRTHCF